LRRGPRADATATDEAAPIGGRIPLREAEHRFGVTVATLGGWARKGLIDAVMAQGARGRRWMVTPESIAHRLARTTHEPAGARPGATGPTSDGTAMLVPRDAWDRLMDQLGNLHDAGLRLAEARERAAKAETEAAFLRERLGEIRAERDQLKERVDGPEASIAAPSPSPSRRTGRIRGWWRRSPTTATGNGRRATGDG